MRTIWLLLTGLMITTTCNFAQVHNEEQSYYFKDTTRTPLAFIAEQFYKNVEGLDSCCLMAFGSAKFIINNSGKIDSVWISVGTPKFIALALEEAIYTTATYWKINKNYKSISVIIPLFMAPSNLCRSDSIKDNVLSSATSMFTYRGSEHRNVSRHNYYKQATGVEAGFVLSPLLIKGRLNDKFIDIFNSK